MLAALNFHNTVTNGTLTATIGTRRGTTVYYYYLLLIFLLLLKIIHTILKPYTIFWPWL